MADNRDDPRANTMSVNLYSFQYTFCLTSSFLNLYTVVCVGRFRWTHSRARLLISQPKSMSVVRRKVGFTLTTRRHCMTRVLSTNRRNNTVMRLYRIDGTWSLNDRGAWSAWIGPSLTSQLTSLQVCRLSLNQTSIRHSPISCPIVLSETSNTYANSRRQSLCRTSRIRSRFWSRLETRRLRCWESAITPQRRKVSNIWLGKLSREKEVSKVRIWKSYHSRNSLVLRIVCSYILYHRNQLYNIRVSLLLFVIWKRSHFAGVENGRADEEVERFGRGVWGIENDSLTW